MATKEQWAVGDLVIVKPEAAPSVSRGGIILPKGSDVATPGKGVVVSVGDGVNDSVFDLLSEGDTVQFDTFGAFDVGDGLLGVRGESILTIEAEVIDGPLDDDDDDVDIYCPSRARVFDDIMVERNYQDAKFGGAAFDDTQTENDWVKYIDEYAGGHGRAVQHDFRTRMVKVAALAVAAIQSHDRKAEPAVKEDALSPTWTSAA